MALSGGVDGALSTYMAPQPPSKSHLGRVQAGGFWWRHQRDKATQTRGSFLRFRPPLRSRLAYVCILSMEMDFVVARGACV